MKILCANGSLRLLTSMLFLCFLTVSLYGQKHTYLNEVVANPPNAAALEKYTELPVNTHTGTPNVGIPLYNLTDPSGLSVPISLSYHAGGVRVSENASSVGLGWSLSAGGAIVRTVRGMPDEGPMAVFDAFLTTIPTPTGTVEQGMSRRPGYFRIGSMLDTAFQLETISGILANWPNCTSCDLLNGKLDGQPDVFSFNFNGYSGKFSFDPQGNVVLNSVNSEIKIKPYFIGGATAGSFDYWEITTPDGNTYIFGQVGKSELDGEDKAVDLMHNYGSKSNPHRASRTISAWYLTEIRTADKLDTVKVSYEREAYRYFNRGADKVHVNANSSATTTPDFYDAEFTSEVLAAKISQISSKWEEVRFGYASTPRHDLLPVTLPFSLATPNHQNNPSARALESIVVLNKLTGDTIKRIELKTDYFISSAEGIPAPRPTDFIDTTDRYRLRLTQVSISDKTFSEGSLQKYALEYFNSNDIAAPLGVKTDLPRRKAAAQDIWGFYNGKKDNEGLIPYAEVYTSNYTGPYSDPNIHTTLGDIAKQFVGREDLYELFFGTFLTAPQVLGYGRGLNEGISTIAKKGDFKTGDRSPAFPFMQEATLKKIHYPTGGNAAFEFEPHTTKGVQELVELSNPLTNGDENCPCVSPFYNNCCTTDAGTGIFTASGTNQNIGPIAIQDRYLRIKKFKTPTGVPIETGGIPHGATGIFVPDNISNKKLVYKLKIANTTDTTTGSGSNPLVFQFRVIKVTNGANIPVNEKTFSVPAGGEINVLDLLLPNLSNISSNDEFDILCDYGSDSYTLSKTARITFSAHLFDFNLSTTDKMVGGLRIKKITTTESSQAAPVVKNYSYTENGYSSGVLFQKPSVLSNLKLYPIDTIDIPEKTEKFFSLLEKYPDGRIDPAFISNNLLPVYVYNDGFSNPLSSTANNQTGHIGYRSVTVSQTGAGHSRFDYFVELPPFGGEPSPKYPKAPEKSISGLTGKLIKEVHGKENGDFISETSYNYTETSSASLVGYLIQNPAERRLKKYRIRSNYDVRLNSKQEFKDGVITTTNYVFQPATTPALFEGVNLKHSKPIEEIVEGSDGKMYKNRIFYPQDLFNIRFGTNPSVAQGLKDLILRNMVGAPVRTEMYTNNTLVKATETEFQQAMSPIQIPLPKRFITKNRASDRIAYTVENYSLDNLPTQGRANGFTISESFSWNQQRLATKSFGGLQQTYTYKANANLIESITDENGITSRFEYDDMHRLKKTHQQVNPATNIAQSTTEYSYHYRSDNDPFNYVATVTDYLGRPVSSPQLTSKSYVDGLGRPTQNVKEFYTPSKLHQKNFVTYDALGRQDRVYQPFESNSVGFQSIVPSTPIEYRPYTRTEYEASPLSRPLKQYEADGTSFSEVAYSANSASEVRLFSIDANNIVTSSGFFAAAQLYKTILTDQNGKQTHVYKDKLDRVILTRKFLAGQNVDTYNVYDDYGDLRMVIPPGALDAAFNISLDLVFEYRYDNENRLSAKKIPGSEWQYFYYDDRDLLTLTQDGNTRAENALKYMGTLYDALGRVVKTGWVITSDPIQMAKNVQILEAEKLTETTYVPNRTWVKDVKTRVLAPNGTPVPKQWLTTYYWQCQNSADCTPSRDNYTGLVKWVGQDHFYLGIDWTNFEYNALSQPTKTTRFHHTNTGQMLDVRNGSEYDHAMRLQNTSVYTKLSYAGHTKTLIQPWLRTANLNYNFKDQLIERNLSWAPTGKYLQSIDYAYNARGFLTDINPISVYRDGTGGPVIA
jgi:hypothetical protein